MGERTDEKHYEGTYQIICNLPEKKGQIMQTLRKKKADK